MGTGKVLGGLSFVIIGIILLVIGFVPIPGLEDVSFTALVITTFEQIFAITGDIMTAVLAILLNTYFYIALIIPWIGYHYVSAGIKSMRYDKPKKQYYYTETKIGLLITGFIMICVALTFILMIFLGYLSPAFDFLNPVIALIPFDLSSIASFIPTLLIPVLLTILIIFFVYWIGSKIMKSGVKKESLIT